MLFLIPNAMSLSSNFRSQLSFSRFASWAGKSLLLGTGASLFVTSGNAQAVETIQLRYYGSSSTVPSEITLSLDEIKTFVQAGELRQQVREFFDINRQDIDPVQRVFTQQIQVPASVGDNFVDTSVGRFVLSQLEELVQGSNPVPNLRIALRESIQDDRTITLLEVLENYPTETVALNITGLVQTYGEISAFVDRVLPALEVAREYLQGIVCNCEQPTASSTSTQSSPNSSLQATTCTAPQTVTSTSTQVAPAQPQPAQIP